MLFRFDNFENVHVRNYSEKPSVVILLPITRTSYKSQANWSKILEILEKSEVSAIVILDKTPNAEASTYFCDFFQFEFIDLYLVRRPPSEPIYDSQGAISIGDGLWIIQLHDDDQWAGSLAIPEDAQENELFSINFYFGGEPDSNYIEWEKSPPARINFTLLPSKVWNHFTKFIGSQGGHVAGSVDSTLNVVSRLICNHRTLTTFDYYYDDRHWENRREASENLRKLALQDGWSKLASVEIQLLNRNIDNFVAIDFFESLIPRDKIESAKVEMLRIFQPTLKRRILILARHQIFFILGALYRTKHVVRKSTEVGDLELFVTHQQKLNRVILKSWKFRSNAQILHLVEEFQEAKDFPLLNSRFSFWKSFLVK
jgi:hypothetical protein